MAIKYEAELPGNVPPSAAAYEVPAVKVAAASVRATAKALGLTGAGGDVVTTTDLLGYNEGRHRLEVHKASGAVAYYHRDKYGRDPKQDFTLSDRRADAIARKFIERSKLVPAAAAQLAAVTHMHSAVGDLKARQVKERIVDAGVVYRRTINGVPVDGPGGFVLVSVDPEGEVIAARRIWRPVGKQVGKVKLRRPEAARQAFEKHVSRLRGDVTVIRAGFGYFELGALDRQRVIEPAYSFVYEVRAKELAFKSAFVLHAGDKQFGQLMGKKRFPAEPQRARRG